MIGSRLQDVERLLVIPINSLKLLNGLRQALEIQSSFRNQNTVWGVISQFSASVTQSTAAIPPHFFLFPV